MRENAGNIKDNDYIGKRDHDGIAAGLNAEIKKAQKQYQEPASRKKSRYHEKEKTKKTDHTKKKKKEQTDHPEKR